MGVKVRERLGKGWYVLSNWQNKRKAKCFGKRKALAKAFADKFIAKLKWAEQSGEAITLGTKDGTTPTGATYLTEWLTVMPSRIASRRRIAAANKPLSNASFRRLGIAHCIY